MNILLQIRDSLWSFPLLALLFISGLYLTFVLKGLQFRYLLRSMHMAIFCREEPGAGKKGDFTHFQALMTSLAGAIGTGNIAGVATAIAVGGLGAVFLDVGHGIAWNDSKIWRSIIGSEI